MRIKQLTDESITLTLPKKQRYLGLALIVLGTIIPIYLWIINNYQIFFTSGSNLQGLIFNFSIICFLGYLIILEIPGIFYFFSIRNTMTGLGHLLLVFLNIPIYIGVNSSIFAFSVIFIVGIYLLTHFKTLTVNKTEEIFHFHERFFLFFFSKTSIPFAEIREFTLEYKYGLEFLDHSKEKHQYHIILNLFERDPGFMDTPLRVEEEEDSPDFYRPQILRKTLISKPTLLASSYFNFNGIEMVKFNKLVKELLRVTEFTLAEEIKKNEKTLLIFRK